MQAKKIIRISAIVFFVFVCIMQTTSNLNQSPEILGKLPNSAGDPLVDSDLFLNSSTIRREVDLLNITYFDAENDWCGPSAIVTGNVTLNNGLQVNVTMTEIDSTVGARVYSGNFKAGFLNATGTAKVSLIIYGQGYGVARDDDGSYFETITIVNNAPTIGVTFNQTQYLRSTSLGVSFFPSDVEDGIANLTWEAYVNDYAPLVIKGTKVFTATYALNTTISLGSTNYVTATCWDSDSATSTAMKYYFTVVDNTPVITSLVVIKTDGEATETFTLTTPNSTPIQVFRSSDTVNQTVLTIKVNATDVESTSDLTMTLVATDPITKTNVLFPSTQFVNIASISSGYFVKNVTFKSTTGLGLIQFMVRINDNDGIYSESNFTIKIMNNPPTITNFFINGKDTGPFSFAQGTILNFTFSVDDVESKIAYVKVAIAYNDASGKTTWFNYTTNYVGSETLLVVRAYDLPIQTFSAYAYVIDSDGAETKVNVSYQFAITANDTNTPMIWLFLVVGMIIGITAGIGFMAWRARKAQYQPSESSESKPTSNGNKEKKSKQEKLQDVDEDSDSDVPQSAVPKKDKKKLIRQL